MQDTHQILTGLIATCRDSEDRFGKAGQHVHTDSLRNRLTAIARQRADFAAELSDCLKPHGAEPPQSTHHRELERTIRPKDDTTLIAQCFEGEENTLRHYESALTHDLPAPIRPVVDRQRLAVQAALLDFHGMEMLRKAS
jgi:uncharacterized protein (TIGR02284 family)